MAESFTPPEASGFGYRGPGALLGSQYEPAVPFIMELIAAGWPDGRPVNELYAHESKMGLARNGYGGVQ